MTLNEYLGKRTCVVLFWSSVGCPCGEYCPMGEPNIEFCPDFDERFGVLEGTLDSDGTWGWNGLGRPKDVGNNVITRLIAYVAPRQWAALVEEYYSDR
jgi:hypothetical protein